MVARVHDVLRDVCEEWTPFRLSDRVKKRVLVYNTMERLTAEEAVKQKTERNCCGCARKLSLCVCEENRELNAVRERYFDGIFVKHTDWMKSGCTY